MQHEFAGARVDLYRSGSYREVVLRRPSRHNAIDVLMRDELVRVFRVLLVDEDARTIGLRGEGPSFCSGGDLDEFGLNDDPVQTHLARTARSLPWLVFALSPRLTTAVHGACVGAGLELAAFARRVIAARDTRFRLPEVGMGLLPGMGGTVSVSRRIGRSRALAMMLSGAEIDADTACAWTLVDEVVDPDELVDRLRGAE